ncbi:alpha/beta fold hydrolase [Microterricola pindariensis]|uniref:Esterase n=1 Tax=Microterricola pindariensis TaxID=478010 RepID=A0ABX5AVH4_9MICO|nr:alpha/beta hydrolase [Microterricola pindariensis]PPL17476.1 esterase [Microterricola pindariensis]
MTWLSTLRARLGGLGRRRRPATPVLHIASDVGEGPTVVLVHGIASSSVTFLHLVPLLEPNFRCVSIDILGFGRSPAPEGAEYTLDEHVAALHATIKAQSLRGPLIIVGHSLGSLISARFAAEHPQLVAHLVLISPPVYLPPTNLGDKRAKLENDLYLRAYDYLRTNKEFTLANARIIAKLLPIKGVFELREDQWEPFVKSMQNCVENQTVISDLSRVTAPIDVVYGALDQFIPRGGLEIVGRMRGVTMHRVEANAHIIRRRLARVVAGVLNADLPAGVEPNLPPELSP